MNKIQDLEFENKNLKNEIEILKIGRNQLEKQLREKDEKIDTVVHELETIETKKKISGYPDYNDERGKSKIERYQRRRGNGKLDF